MSYRHSSDFIGKSPANPGAAAGPITITRYENGKPVEVETLPAPGEQEFKEKFRKAGRPPKVDDSSLRGKASRNYSSNPF